MTDSSPDPPADPTPDAQSALWAARRVAPGLPDDATVRRIGDGYNEVFVVDGADLVVKFGTHSTAAHLRAGVGAYRLLGAYTDLPVPSVHAFAPAPDGSPPFVVLERRPGEHLAAGFRDPAVTDERSLRALGDVISRFAAVPPGATEGYGRIRRAATGADGPRVVAERADCRAWLVDYATGYLTDPPDHEALTTVAPRAAAWLRANRDRLPTAPPESVVVTDLSPENLLAPEGRAECVAGLTGVLDLERARVGPARLTAANAAHLLGRYVADPERVRATLYDPLPFDPGGPAADAYRMVAMSRSVAALPVWYDPDGARFRERGRALATGLEAIVGDRAGRSCGP